MAMGAVITVGWNNCGTAQWLLTSGLQPRIGNPMFLETVSKP